MARLEWFFEYDGKEIPNRFTPHVSPGNQFLRAVSRLVAAEGPSPPNGFQYYFRDLNRKSLGNGVDQIHCLLLSRNNAASFKPIPMQGVDVGRSTQVSFPCSTFVDRGRPGDAAYESDSLRYDLQSVGEDGTTAYIPNGIMNRRTGVFTIRSTDMPRGTYSLRAFLSDGKGGNAIRNFTVWAY